MIRRSLAKTIVRFFKNALIFESLKHIDEIKVLLLSDSNLLIGLLSIHSYTLSTIDAIDTTNLFEVRKRLIVLRDKAFQDLFFHVSHHFTSVNGDMPIVYYKVES